MKPLTTEIKNKIIADYREWSGGWGPWEPVCDHSNDIYIQHHGTNFHTNADEVDEWFMELSDEAFLASEKEKGVMCGE